jgi:hypothetical protein
VAPVSFRTEWRRRAKAAIAPPNGTPPVTEGDLAGLPAPVAGYVRASGAVGKPRVTNFLADIHGRIRSGPGDAWMAFTGRQLNTYGAAPRRLFFIRASMRALPVDVLHVYEGGSATMRVKLLRLKTIVDAAGPEMDRGETVTVFNDLVLLAPAALVDAPIRWTAIDDRRVRGTFTSGSQSVAAELLFDADRELVDFVSDDRLRASADGRSFTPQRWSTPVGAYQDLHGRRVIASGEGRWHAPAPEGEFAYIEFNVDELVYNLPADERSL